MIHLDISEELKNAYKDYILDKKYQQNLYFKKTIEKSFKDKFKEIYRKEIIKKKRYGDLKKFLKFVCRKLENFIIGDLDKLKDLQNEIEAKFPKFIKNLKKFLRDRQSKKKKVTFKDYEIIYDLFVKKGYESIVSDKMAYEFIKALDVKVCPYCNINYISYVRDNKNKAVRPALDHFYPKEKYPWFAISLYNLVPICKDCNSLKSNKFTSRLRSAYKISENNNDFVFEIDYNILDKNMSLKDIEEEIKKIDFKKSIKGNKEIFKLFERYQFHKDIVAEILWKKISTNEDYLSSFKNLGINEDEAYRIIFCNYLNSENFKQRPLSKLTYDVYNCL